VEEIMKYKYTDVINFWQKQDINSKENGGEEI
jgi:hypothetical protein